MFARQIQSKNICLNLF